VHHSCMKPPILMQGALVKFTETRLSETMILFRMSGRAASAFGVEHSHLSLRLPCTTPHKSAAQLRENVNQPTRQMLCSLSARSECANKL
jgi:hypothetical protein